MQPGDIGFSRTTTISGRLIRLGEWLKGRRAEYNHAFVVDRIQNGVVYIIQAKFHGVTDSMDLRDLPGTYMIMAPPSEVDRDKLLAFVRAQVGAKYSFLTILSIAFDILTWNWVPSVMNSYRASWICSGLVCEGLRYGGWLHPWINLYCVTPQQAFTILQNPQPST